MDPRVADSTALQYQRRLYPALQRPDSPALSNHRSVPSRTSQLDGDRPPPPPPKPDGYHERQAELRALQDATATPQIAAKASHASLIDPRGPSPAPADAVPSQRTSRPVAPRTTDPRLALLQKINTKQELERDVFNSAVEPSFPSWPARTASAPLIPTVAEATPTLADLQGLEMVRPLNTTKKPSHDAPWSAQERPASRGSPRREDSSPDLRQYRLPLSDSNKRLRQPPTFVPPAPPIESPASTVSPIARTLRKPVPAPVPSPTAGLVELPGSSVHDEIIQTLLHVPATKEKEPAPASPNTSLQTLSPAPSTPWSITAYILNDTSYASPARARSSSVTAEEVEPRKRDADRRSRFGWTSVPNSPELMPQGLGIAVPADLNRLELSEAASKYGSIAKNGVDMAADAPVASSDSKDPSPTSNERGPLSIRTREPLPSSANVESKARFERGGGISFGLELLQPTIYTPPTPAHTPQLQSSSPQRPSVVPPAPTLTRPSPLSPPDQPWDTKLPVLNVQTPINAPQKTLSPRTETEKVTRPPSASDAPSRTSMSPITEQESAPETPQEEVSHAVLERSSQVSVSASIDPQELPSPKPKGFSASKMGGGRARATDSDKSKSDSGISIPPSGIADDDATGMSSSRSRTSNSSNLRTSHLESTTSAVSRTSISTEALSISTTRVAPTTTGERRAGNSRVTSDIGPPPVRSFETRGVETGRSSSAMATRSPPMDRSSTFRTAPIVGTSTAIETRTKSPSPDTLVSTRISSTTASRPVLVDHTNRSRRFAEGADVTKTDETPFRGSYTESRTRTSNTPADHTTSDIAKSARESTEHINPPVKTARPRKPSSATAPSLAQTRPSPSQQWASAQNGGTTAFRPRASSRNVIAEPKVHPNSLTPGRGAATATSAKDASPTKSSDGKHDRPPETQSDSSSDAKGQTLSPTVFSRVDTDLPIESKTKAETLSPTVYANSPTSVIDFATSPPPATTPKRSESLTDSPGGASPIADPKDGFALSARYAALRAERSKISAGIASTLVSRGGSQKHADQLLEQYLALDTVNSMMDVCFFQISSLLQAKQERST